MTDDEITDGRLDILEAAEHPWWPVVGSFAFSFLTAILATVLCLSVQTRANHRERQQREQLAVQAAHQHEALCAVIASLDDNAADVHATTPLGIANAKTYAQLRVSQGCPPRTEN